MKAALKASTPQPLQYPNHTFQTISDWRKGAQQKKASALYDEPFSSKVPKACRSSAHWRQIEVDLPSAQALCRLGKRVEGLGFRL